MDNHIHLRAIPETETAVAHYIERNPLKMGLVESPDVYRWSSAKTHLTEANDSVLSASSWLDPSDRAAYSELVLTENDEMDDAIRKATRTGRPFGSEGFVDMLEFRLNQTLRPRKAGQPRKHELFFDDSESGHKFSSDGKVS